MPDFPIQPADTVTVRGTVVQYIAGVGVLVELFSKHGLAAAYQITDEETT